MNSKRKLYKTYTPEFKIKAVRLMGESGRPPAEIAMELCIHRNLLCKWKEQLTQKGNGTLPETSSEVPFYTR